MKTHKSSDDVTKKTKRANEQREETQYSQMEMQKAISDNSSFMNGHFPPIMKGIKLCLLIF